MSIGLSIKPLTTHYNRYCFRSRLEARWAVYFDTLGIPYEYEQEGFDLGNGDYYLPDFYLTEHAVYAEVKPKALDQIEVNKLFRFIHLGIPLLWLIGSPGYHPYYISFLRGELDQDLRNNFCPGCLAPIPIEPGVTIQQDIRFNCVEIWYGWTKGRKFWVAPCEFSEARESWGGSPNPVQAARESRFERGKR